MNQTSFPAPESSRRTIDITPGAGWRRGMRQAGAVLVLAIVLPVLWLVGSLALLGLLGAAAVMLLWGVARQAMPASAGCRHRRGVGAADER